MNRSTRHLMVLVGTVSLLALILAAVFPVGAQDGTGQDQGGDTVTVQETDTLGSLVNQYTLAGEDLRQFFSLNTDLVLVEGQTITFPEGVNVNMNAGNNAGQGTGTETTATPAAGGAADTTATPTAVGGAVPGDNTYVTQEGDVLGEVLAMMGFSPAAEDMPGGAADTTVTPAATETGVAVDTTVTPAATETGVAVDTTATPAVEITETPAAGDAGGAAEATGTPAGGAAGQGQEVTDEQLQEFVTLNSDLQFVSGQTAVLPQGIAVTGQETTATPAAGQETTATPGATGTPAAGEEQGQAEQYTVQAGEDLIDIANRLGITLEELVRLNPDLVAEGDQIIVPAQQGQIPETGQQDGATTIVGPAPSLRIGLEDEPVGTGLGVYIVRSGDSLSRLADRFGITIDEIRALNSITGDTIYRGQRLVLPVGETPGDELRGGFTVDENENVPPSR